MRSSDCAAPSRGTIAIRDDVGESGMRSAAACGISASDSSPFHPPNASSATPTSSACDIAPVTTSVARQERNVDA